VLIFGLCGLIKKDKKQGKFLFTFTLNDIYCSEDTNPL